MRTQKETDLQEEIERLRGDLEVMRLQRDAKHVSRCQCADEVRCSMKAEIERLTAENKLLNDVYEAAKEHSKTTPASILDRAKRIEIKKAIAAVDRAATEQEAREPKPGEIDAYFDEQHKALNGGE